MKNKHKVNQTMLTSITIILLCSPIFTKIVLNDYKVPNLKSQFKTSIGLDNLIDLNQVDAKTFRMICKNCTFNYAFEYYDLLWENQEMKSKDFKVSRFFPNSYSITHNVIRTEYSNKERLGPGRAICTFISQFRRSIRIIELELAVGQCKTAIPFKYFVKNSSDVTTICYVIYLEDTKGDETHFIIQGMEDVKFEVKNLTRDDYLERINFKFVKENKDFICLYKSLYNLEVENEPQ